MAPGAGLMRTGESGKGIGSRWYPETLVTRLRAIRQIRDRLSFQQGDAFEAIRSMPNATLFVDPPYTAAGKRAGRRLYQHNQVDHQRLFDLVAASNGPAMLTYDDNPEVRELAAQHSFSVDVTAMKSTHHAVMHELVILKN